MIWFEGLERMDCGQWTVDSKILNVDCGQRSSQDSKRNFAGMLLP